MHPVLYDVSDLSLLKCKKKSPRFAQPLRLLPLSCPLVNPRPPQPPLPGPLSPVLCSPGCRALPLKELPYRAWSCISFSLRGCSFPISPSTAGPQGLGGSAHSSCGPPTPQPYTPQADHGPPLDNFIFTYEKIRISLQSREVQLKQRGYRWSGLVSSVRSDTRG